MQIKATRNREEIKTTELEDAELFPPPTPCPDTSKIYLDVERFSQETNWRLAERLFYNQGCRIKWSQVGREVIKLGPVPLGGNTEEERDYMSSEIPPPAPPPGIE